MLVTTNAIILSKSWGFVDFMLMKNNEKTLTAATYEQIIEAPFKDLWDLPPQNPSTMISQYVRLTSYLQLMFEPQHYECVAVQRVRRPDISNVKSRLEFDLFVLLVLFIFSKVTSFLTVAREGP